MIELTPDNLGSYLRERGWIAPAERVEVAPLGWGVSNAVFRVRTPGSLFVVKQSRPQLRTRDAWFSDLDRVWREMEVMQVLGPLLPPGVVPAVLHCDRENYAFAMAHAPEESVVWKERLLAGVVEPDLATRVGRVLGQLHEATAREPELVAPFADRTVFVQLRVDPFYRRIQERVPDVAAAVEPLIDAMMSSREALCHGDYSPKNILAHGGGFTLVDYETAHQGDPAMDLGFCTSHLMLKGFRNGAILDLVDRFWRGYIGEVRSLDLSEMERRGVAHLGLCLLARIDGTSPVDYLDEPSRARVRQCGRAILLEPLATWSAALTRARAETAGG
jgi:5-methylthioribose kinase